jgi:hypothetical protein
MKKHQMNRWDSLLAWLAQSPENKWAVVKANCQKLSILEHPEKERNPLWHAMAWAGVLIRLGHAEFNQNQSTVSSCSPGLLWDPVSARAVLYGYWDPSRYSKLRELSVERFIHRPYKGPTCRSICGKREFLQEVAETLGVWFVDDPSVDLLKRLPAISLLLSNLTQSVASTDGYWEQFGYFNDLSWHWRATKIPFAEPGLYQRKDGKSLQVFVAADFCRFALKTMDEKLAAKWQCYHQRFNWLCDTDRNALLVPRGTADLPVLVSRGLTMKSARLPLRVSFERRPWWMYQCVNKQQASEAARIMGQEISFRNLANV